MTDIASFIEKSELLTQFFGRWPSFHDAEILEIRLNRGHIDPKKKRFEFPWLELKIHLWELTNKVDESGYMVLRHHTLAILRFSGTQSLNLVEFGPQNTVMGIDIVRRERADGPSPVFEVALLPADEFAATFSCLRVTVAEVTPCNPDGTIA